MPFICSCGASMGNLAVRLPVRELDRKPSACNSAMPHRIDIVEGDITRLDVDAIVNATNKTLSAAAASAAPSTVPLAPSSRGLRELGGCDTGEAKITPGFGLPARYVIHTVGPVWGGGERGEDGCSPAATATALRWREPRPRLDRLSRHLDRGFGFPARPRRPHRAAHRARRASKPTASSASYSAASARSRECTEAAFAARTVA